MLERNIALALYNRGQYGEAFHYFDRALRFFGVKPQRSRASLLAKFAVCFAHFLVAVHLPQLRFKRTPTQDESEGLRLYYQKLAALSAHDPERFFLEAFLLARWLSRFDLGKVDYGVGMFASSGNLLVWTGVSFYLSRRVLDLLADKIDPSDVKNTISYRAAEITHAFFAGDWDTRPYDDELVAGALDLGEVYLTSNYVIFYGRLALERGELEKARELAERLRDIGDRYEHSYPHAVGAYLHAKTLLKTRQLPVALAECTAGQRIAEEAAVDTMIFGLGALKARVLAFMGELDGADELLRRLEAVGRDIRLPSSYRGDYLLSRAQVDLLLAETSRGQHQGDFRTLARRASKSCRVLRKNSRKVASHRVGAARMTGLAHWLAGDQSSAARSWETGLRTGEGLGARLELARTYFEIGRRLRSPESSLQEIGGFSATECLRRARELFEEMKLDWDLAELEGSTT